MSPIYNHKTISIIIVTLLLVVSACKKEETPNPIKHVQTIHFDEYDCIINYNENKLPISIYYNHLDGTSEIVTQMEYQEDKIVKLINWGLDQHIAWGEEKAIETEYYFNYGFKLTSIYATRWYIWPFIITTEYPSHNTVITVEDNKSTTTFEHEGYQTITLIGENVNDHRIEYLETDNRRNPFTYFPEELKLFYHVCYDFENRSTNDINFGPYLEHNPTLIRSSNPNDSGSLEKLYKYTNYEYNESFLPTNYTKISYDVDGTDTVEISQTSVSIDYSEGF